jgi:hypothetical protein
MSSSFFNHQGINIVAGGAMWAGTAKIRVLIVPESRLLQLLQNVLEEDSGSCVPANQCFFAYRKRNVSMSFPSESDFVNH